MLPEQRGQPQYCGAGTDPGDRQHLRRLRRLGCVRNVVHRATCHWLQYLRCDQLCQSSGNGGSTQTATYISYKAGPVNTGWSATLRPGS